MENPITTKTISKFMHNLLNVLNSVLEDKYIFN